MKLHPQEDAGLIETTLVTCIHCEHIDAKLCSRCELLIDVLKGNESVDVSDDILTKDTK